MPDQFAAGDGSPQPKKRSKVGRFAEITRAAAGISIVVGVIAGIFGLINGIQSLRSSALTAKQMSYPQVKEVINENTQIKPKEVDFSKSFAGEDGKEKLRQLVKDKGSVSNAYFSEDLKSLRDIGHHYEQMGALVKHGYIDFDLIYDLIPFPDEFWDETDEFRHAAQYGNWSSGKPLPDFWKNFGFLHDQYEKRRAKEERR